MQIQISWLTDLDLHCLLRQGMLCSAREVLNSYFFKSLKFSLGLFTYSLFISIRLICLNAEFSHMRVSRELFVR